MFSIKHNNKLQYQKIEIIAIFVHILFDID